MKRKLISPRANWQQLVSDHGLTFYEADDPASGRFYWTENAYYEFSSAEIDRLEGAVAELERMCRQAVEHVITHRRWVEFSIAPEFVPWVEASWRRGERGLYGRFDLAYDGTDIKMLEYNADTPTSLIEAASAQWFWLKQQFAESPEVDQWNSMHEALIAGWRALRREYDGLLHFTSVNDEGEDFCTASYLRDTAMQAGFQTEYLPIERVGWDQWRNRFTDEREREIEAIFKLYPWEWLLRESFGQHLPKAGTRWIEPPWKMILSNKALLVLLHELFPGHPLLLPASYTREPELGNSYVRKPQFGREGASTSLICNGQVVDKTSGPYETEFGGRFVYQQAVELPEFNGCYPVLGAWVINGVPAGMGIREGQGRITTNHSSFVPHVIDG